MDGECIEKWDMKQRDLNANAVIFQSEILEFEQMFMLTILS